MTSAVTPSVLTRPTYGYEIPLSDIAHDTNTLFSNFSFRSYFTLSEQASKSVF
ncbi:unnamed protein product [Callosobruchus maculatus]|uniref:Uncharacterized protein n=1 Tax=Callosobruchus maculatus TaxID=64391 RepID=A0A653CN22_CALMS|nr:unnamed protein product [Callosobruchus maculatus]